MNGFNGSPSGRVGGKFVGLSCIIKPRLLVWIELDRHDCSATQEEDKGSRQSKQKTVKMKTHVGLRLNCLLLTAYCLSVSGGGADGAGAGGGRAALVLGTGAGERLLDERRDVTFGLATDGRKL